MSQHEERDGKKELTVLGDIAIIGMACLFAGAPDLNAYWHNILTRFDAITDPPPESWDADVFYSADSKANDRVYCKRGGFLGPIARFNPLKHGVMPSALDGSEPDQWLALEVARTAFEDAGYSGEIPERHRTAVILGKGTYLNRGNLTAAQHGQVVDQTLVILRSLHPEYTEADLKLIREELKSCLPPFNTDTAQGLIPNVTVGRIANRLDLMGPSYTVDAACASSLVAVDIARRDLLTGRCDLALVGGMHVVTPVPVLMLFCQLGALSHQQMIRPFDKDADGTILSEGVGMAVLKRREDAERDGNRIYAIIKGVGTASDGRALSVLAPRVEGEELALRLAYEQAAISPRTVGLIEAHGTATLVGDATEIQALTRVIGERDGELPRAALGTIKSMIGHTMPAAGIAGLIKTALALYHKTLPPTLHVDQPSPRLELEKTPFYINTETRPWIHGSSEAPRRAGVNAFGFGGINAHVVLEEYPVANERLTQSHHLEWETELCMLQGESRADLVREGRRLQQFLQAGPDVQLKDLAYTLNTQNATLGARSGLRLALIASSTEDLQHKLDTALGRLVDPACHKIKDRNGIYFFDEPLGRSNKLAFLFPGEGAQYVNMLAELCIHFPQVRERFDEIDRVFEKHARGYVPSDFIYPRPVFSEAEREEAERRIWQMDVAIEALVTANHALYTLLADLGIRPDAMLGHSTGEFSAMRAAGMLETEGYDRRLLKLNQRYGEVAARGAIPEATLLAVGAGREQVEALIEEADAQLFVAMDNCPHQTVLAGSREATDRACDLATRKGFICERLSFDRAYHTPLYAPYAEVVRAAMSEWIVSPPELPIYSCTTMAPFPAHLADAQRIAHEHWMAPVEFRRTIDAMYDDGVRLFVEVGPRGNLTAFVEDILRGRPALVAPADVSRRSGITQLNHLLGMLAAHAVPMQLEQLYVRRAPRPLDLEHPSDPLHAGKRPGVAVKLGTGWPPMGILDETAARLRAELAARVEQSEASSSEKLSFAAPADDPSPVIVRPVEVRPHLGPDTRNGHHKPVPTAAPLAMTTNDNAPPAAQEVEATTNGYHQPAARDVPVATPPEATIASVNIGPAETSAPTTQVMSAYLQTMEQFLGLQQDVMQAYLAGPPAPPATNPPLVEVALPVAVPPLSTAAPVPVPRVVVEETLAATTAAQPQVVEVVAPIIVESPVQIAAASVVAAPSPLSSSAVDAAVIGQTLLRIVSDKTGYPAEMLDLNLDLEADLGIDSIKRVEILGGFQQETGIRVGDQMDLLSATRTLQGVIDALVERESPPSQRESEQGNHANSSSGAAEVRPAFPFLDKVVELTPDQTLVVEYEVSLATCPFLRDHTLGRQISRSDPKLTGLPVMPLTMSMEMLAEAAAELMPGWCLVGMKEVRASRWIALDQDSLTLRMSARRTSSREVHVQIHEAEITSPPAGAAPAPIVEGTMVFAEVYPQAPMVGAFPLNQEQPGKWRPERLYEEAMFHGPAFRGVQSLDRVGDDGAEARLMTLEADDLLPAGAARALLTDPVLLDQPGQVVGFWAAQLLPKGYLVFPYRLEALHFYGPPPPATEVLMCQARIALLGEHQTRSDLDIIRSDGQVCTRFIGWEDRRFDLPRPFYRLLLAPEEAILGEPWPELTALLPEPEAFHAYRLSLHTFADGLLTGHGGIWQKVLARLVLGRRELELWRGLRMPEPRRLEWLLGRVVAKDAVRAYLRQRYGLLINPADVEILPDANGRPVVHGAWTRQVPDAPLVSLAHTAGIAVALVGAGDAVAGVGVDIELAGRMNDDVAQLAFTPEEQTLLSTLPGESREDWALRFWCVKEAAAKALGEGMVGGPQALVVQGMDEDPLRLRVEVAGELGRRMPEAASSSLVAYTIQEEDLVVAACLYGKKETYATKP